MTNFNLKDLEKRADAAKAKAKAEGTLNRPDGTYTFNNTDAAVVSSSLGLVSMILDGQLELGLLLLARTFAGNERQASATLARISKEILDKQCPAYINEAVDGFLKDARETNPELQ